MERRYFESSYGKISFLHRQGEIPLIFLHGLGGSGNTWIRLSQHIDSKYGLYLLDLLGHGRSAKPELEYTIGTQEIILKELLEETGAEKFGLVGNSYGGWISLRFAVDELVPSIIVLEDSAGVNQTFGEFAWEKRNRIIEMLLNENRMNSKMVLSSIIENNSRPKWKMKESELRSLNSKVMIIWGSEDKIIPISNGHRLNELIPGSTFYEVKGGRHVPHISDPKLIGSLIDSFIKS